MSRSYKKIPICKQGGLYGSTKYNKRRSNKKIRKISKVFLFNKVNNKM